MIQLEIPGLESIFTIMREQKEKEHEVKGTKVVSSDGERDFSKEDRKLQKGVVVRDAQEKGHLDIDRSEIFYLPKEVKPR